MATKSTTTKTVAPRAPRSTLRATDVPGVFRNRANVLVDSDGIALDFKRIKKADDDRFKEVTGSPADTPMSLMEGVMRDPRNPLHVRADIANKLLPFKHPKLVAVQGVAGAAPINIGFENKSDAELAEIRRKLEELANMITASK